MFFILSTLLIENSGSKQNIIYIRSLKKRKKKKFLKYHNIRAQSNDSFKIDAKVFSLKDKIL